jgi:hypothetical protein
MIPRFSKRTVHHEASISIHGMHVSTQYTIYQHTLKHSTSHSVPILHSNSVTAHFKAKPKIMATEHLLQKILKRKRTLRIFMYGDSLQILFIHTSTYLLAWDIPKSLTISYNTFVRSIISSEVNI